MACIWSWKAARTLGLSLVVILLVGASCEKPKVMSVSIEPSELSLLVGKTHALTVFVGVRGGADRTVEWRSADPSVATVTSSGVVEGVSAGVTEVSARSAFDSSIRDAIPITVEIAPARHALSVTPLGSGAGVVSSDPLGIECGEVCGADFDDGASVTLTANAAAGSSFTGWGGACTGTGTCTLSMTAAQSVTAVFDAVLTAPRTLDVTLLGSGSGTVTSSPPGIDCGAMCAADFEDGTSVTLTANAAAGSSFTGWGGACTGTGTCTLSMTAAQSVTATFDTSLAVPRSLSVAFQGTGLGTVTSSPTRIDCGAMCAADFEDGTSVTLTANAATGSSFTGWGGACTGTGTCTLSMTAARSVTATFDTVLADPQTLTVTRAGFVSGTVTSSPTGINCGAACSAQFEQGTSVTLTATAAAGATFSGWSGACTGSAATCTVSMTQARDVTATFMLVAVPMHTLSVTRAGQGSGTVSSSPTGIDCGSTCSAMFEQGTSVALTASAAWGSVFSGWSGACTGTAATCTVSMTQARSVTATFGQLVIVIAPPNDNFANSLLLPGFGSTTGSNRFATKEAGEPPHAYRAGVWNPGGKSVWWHWTAPYTGWVAFDTFGSNFDTMLGVYTGSAVHELTWVGFSDDASGTLQSRAVFPVRAGVTYRIAVDGFRLPSDTADEGDIVLNWGVVAQPTSPPLNDAFAWSIPLRGSSGTTTGSNLNATKEAGEPNHWTDGGASVWWHWTAPSTGSVTVSTFGSSFDTVLALYTGSTVGGLQLVAANDDDGGPQSRVTFTATGGATYRIAVDGFRYPAPTGLQTGAIVLNWGP